MKHLKTFLFVILLIITNSVWAKTFTSQYTEFELPSGWECALEGSEWVCQSNDKDRKKEAIIILAAKFRGEQDSLDGYKAYLKQPKSFTLPGGKQQISEAKSVDNKVVNGQTWIDSLHLASEVPGFYTRYLATVKDNLGIAVTFSVAKDHYNDYQEIFDKIVATLRVFSQNANGNFVPKTKTAEGALTSGTIDNNAAPVDITATKQNKKSSGDDSTTAILGILVLAAGGFIFLKMKKKKK